MPTKEEIKENFYIKYGNKLTELLIDIQKDYETNGIPLLNNQTKTMEADFVDIILYSVKEKNIMDD